MSSFEFAPRHRMNRTILILGIAGIAVLGVLDGLRSIGQNTEATSLADNARTVLLDDFNGWEQFKDYVAPQISATDPALTKNEDRAPLTDPNRNIDYGHAILSGSLIATVLAAKIIKD